jgi:hypothetical protein
MSVSGDIQSRFYLSAWLALTGEANILRRIARLDRKQPPGHHAPLTNAGTGRQAAPSANW